MMMTAMPARLRWRSQVPRRIRNDHALPRLAGQFYSGGLVEMEPARFVRDRLRAYHQGVLPEIDVAALCDGFAKVKSSMVAVAVVAGENPVSDANMAFAVD